MINQPPHLAALGLVQNLEVLYFDYDDSQLDISDFISFHKIDSIDARETLREYSSHLDTLQELSLQDVTEYVNSHPFKVAALGVGASSGITGVFGAVVGAISGYVDSGLYGAIEGVKYGAPIGGICGTFLEAKWHTAAIIYIGRKKFNFKVQYYEDNLDVRNEALQDLEDQIADFYMK